MNMEQWAASEWRCPERFARRWTGESRCHKKAASLVGSAAMVQVRN
jgi:hypothetical protein